MGDNGKVVERVPKVSLEIRDMDSDTTIQEVQEALKRDLKELAGEIKVFITKPNSRSQIMAIVEVNERAANELGSARRSE